MLVVFIGTKHERRINLPDEFFKGKFGSNLSRSEVDKKLKEFRDQLEPGCKISIEGRKVV